MCLDAWIIEREWERQREDHRLPAVRELDLPRDRGAPPGVDEGEPGSDRGVRIVSISPDAPNETPFSP